jgi:hypothetical protein
MNEKGSVCGVCVQEIIFGGQLLGGGIKCLWNEVPLASKLLPLAYRLGTVGLTPTAIVFLV